MHWIIYILIGFAIGVEAGRMQKGQRCDWKKSLLVVVIALVIAGAVSTIMAWWK